MATKQKQDLHLYAAEICRFREPSGMRIFFSFQHSQQFSENNLTAASSIKLLADDWIGGEIFLTFIFFFNIR